MNKSIEVVKKELPEINDIMNKDLKERVAQVWLEAWKASSWERLNDAPFAPGVPNVGLIEHVRAVIGATKSVARIFSEAHKVAVNMDLLLTGALLHDVSKLLESERKEGDYIKTEIGKLLPHGYYGAHIALDFGMPTEVAHLIATHSHLAQRMVPQTIEGIILHYVDFCNADFLMMSRGLKTILAMEQEK